MMKTTRHSLMAKGILVLLSLLIMVFVFTYSWYMDPATPVSASGISLTTSANMDFEYAIGFSNSQTGNSYYISKFEDGEIDLSGVLAVDNPLSLDLLCDNTSSGEIAYKENGMRFDVLKDYNPIDITGDGYTLIRPAMNYGNWSINTATSNYSYADEGEQYIYFDLIIRSKSQCSIALDTDSYAKGACERTPGNGALSVGKNSVETATEATSGQTKVVTYADHNTLLEAYNQSTYGDFSKDAVVGSLRVAFLEYENKNNEPVLTYADLLTKRLDNNLKETPSLLWIPRPDIVFNSTDDTTGWTLENAQVGGDTYLHQYYDIFENIDDGNGGLVPNKNVITDTRPCVAASQVTQSKGVVFNQTKNVVSVSVPGPDGDMDADNDPDYYYGKVRVRIWIEGTDSEARRAITGGNFKLAFNLTAVMDSGS